MTKRHSAPPDVESGVRAGAGRLQLVVKR